MFYTSKLRKGNFKFYYSLVKRTFLLRLFKYNLVFSPNIPHGFIVASGRSGTKFLAKMLKNDPSCCAFHEPVPMESIAHSRALTAPDSAEHYISRYRKYDIYKRIKENKCKKYIESNGYIRLHIPSLKKSFPYAKFIQLVRDPRDVVRSQMNRDIFFNNHPVYSSKFGPPYGMKAEEWNDMDRFKKICWLWQYENSIMRKEADMTVRFETLIKDYKYFKSNILDKFELSITEEVWSREVSIPVNISYSYEFPPYKEWSDEHNNDFKSLCEKEASYYNYDFNSD